MDNTIANGNKRSQNWDFDYIGSSQEIIFEKFQTSPHGLTDQEAQRRLHEYGFNEPARKKELSLSLGRGIATSHYKFFVPGRA